MKRNDYKPLGDYITLVNERNRDLAITHLVGVSIEKKFIPSIANIIGTDLSPYKIIRHNQFAYGPVTSRNGEKITIALYKDTEDGILSQAYEVFRIKDEEVLMPEYLMLWVQRPEFDRYARFKSHGSVRELFSWEEMCNVMLPVPPIAEQRKIVEQYQTIERRIKNNEALIQKLEATAQTLYHHTFVEGIDKENLPEGWRMGKLGDVCKYANEKISSHEIESSKYISTEDMLKDKMGIEKTSVLPENTNVTAYKQNDILISNIRPYYKKIWYATCDGGCSTDVLCYRADNQKYSKFLYHTLYDNRFFNYVVAGCKGTKMPRGDKYWNMEYCITIPLIQTLDQFNNETLLLDNHIQLLLQENDILRSLLTLFTSKLS